MCGRQEIEGKEARNEVNVVTEMVTNARQSSIDLTAQDQSDSNKSFAINLC